MNYAKFINNVPTYAPNPVKHDGLWYGNPPGSVYEAEGYKPVTYTQPPQTEPGCRTVESWTETDEAIVQSWTVEEVTELDGEEAMRMLFGEEGEAHVE